MRSRRDHIGEEAAISEPPPGRRGRLARISGLAGWSAASQAASAASNLLVELSVVAFVGVTALGEWSLRYAVLLAVVYLVRASVGDVLLADRAPDPELRADPRVPSLFGLVLCIGVLSAAAGAVVAQVTHDVSWLAVGVAILFALVQDFLRYLGFWALQPWRSAILDLLWVVCSLLGAVAVHQHPSVVTAVVVWGSGALVGAVVGLLWLRLRPRSPRAAVRWWLASRRMSVPSMLDTGLYLLGNQGLWVLLAAVAGAAALGSFRLALLVANPALLAYLAAQTVLVPLLARRGDRTLRMVLRAVVAVTAVGLVVLAVTALVALPLLRLVGIGQGELSVGLTVATVCYVVFSAPYVVLASALRARWAGRAFLGMRLTTTAAAVAVALLLVGPAGATGVMVAMALGVAAALLPGWLRVRAAAGTPVSP